MVAITAGCSDKINHWSDLVPGSALYVVVPDQNSSVSEILNAPYTPLFDDITPTAMQLSANIDTAGTEEVVVESIILFPDTSNDWQPVWIVKPVVGLMENLKETYQEKFAQNRYEFESYTIEKLFISDRDIFVVDVGSYIIFSESSLGIEQSLRTMSGKEPRMNLSEHHTSPGTFIANTPSLDKWVRQFAKINYRPELHDIFEGGEPIAFSLHNNEDTEWNWQLSGTLAIGDDPSILLRGIRSAPEPFILDRYISTNSAAFSILRLEPRSVPPNNEEELTFEIDQYLNENPDHWRSISSSLDNEIAFVSFAESGAESTSEFMFLRSLKNASQLRSQLSMLAAREGVIAEENTFMVQSKWLGDLIGSELNTMTNFYLTIVDDVAILAQRRGLAESVAGDASRRRVMYYDDDYRMVREDRTTDLSSLTYIDTGRFGTYIQPWLSPQNYYAALASNLDLLVISSTASENGSTVDIDIASYQREISDEPFRERWVFPVSSDEITGTPVLADITASGRDEIIFSTVNGSVFVLATDGTQVHHLTTEGDVPIGPPVVYDWYGNSQNVILQAAGNNIYAWNMNGSMLPNFPISLNESITTPLTIQDVTRNGIAEIIVGTADRKLHILNSRGESISGWPHSVNTVITDKPLITTIENQRLIFATAENTIHGWEINGQVRDGFPVFLDTSLYGSPGSHLNHLLAAGRDGNLYSIGSTPLFNDTLVTDVSENGLIIQKLQVSSSGLNSQPYAENLLLRSNEEFLREDLIVVQSSNGSVFLYNEEGKLRFTRSMGQPSSGKIRPQVTDINRDQRMDIVSLTNFGRIYAWNILTDERLYGLPTTGMQFPLITDLYNDGNNEIIAYTREGLRCWTILKTQTESEREQQE